ncbi:MAG: response regulator, partial [Planctomycetaceae bacterium]|nr:response regulator [Planctomycetaceae bacterium]
LLTDIVMPGMTGHELAQTLRQQRPGLPALFISGYADTDFIPSRVRDTSTAFLQKPFTQSEIIIAIESLMRRY